MRGNRDPSEPVGPGNPPYHPEGIWAAREALEEAAAARAETQQRIEQLAREDPTAVIRELFAEASKAAVEMYRKFNRSGRKESVRDLMDASREARQLADRLLDLIRAEGDAAQAQQFLATLHSRVEALAPLLADDARPLAHPST